MVHDLSEHRFEFLLFAALLPIGVLIMVWFPPGTPVQGAPGDTQLGGALMLLLGMAGLSVLAGPSLAGRSSAREEERRKTEERWRIENRAHQVKSAAEAPGGTSVSWLEAADLFREAAEMARGGRAKNSRWAAELNLEQAWLTLKRGVQVLRSEVLTAETWIRERDELQRAVATERAVAGKLYEQLEVAGRERDALQRVVSDGQATTVRLTRRLTEVNQRLQQQNEQIANLERTLTRLQDNLTAARRAQPSAAQSTTGSEFRWALRVFGLDEGAFQSWPAEERMTVLKGLYRARSKFEHPDTQGVNPFANTRAHQRMADLNRAYEILTRQR